MSLLIAMAQGIALYLKPRADAATLRSAQIYLDSGRVNSHDIDSVRGKLSFEISGTHAYYVHYWVNPSTKTLISRTSCSCSHDGLCRHLVASLLWLKANTQAQESLLQSRGKAVLYRAAAEVEGETTQPAPPPAMTSSSNSPPLRNPLEPYHIANYQELTSQMHLHQNKSVEASPASLIAVEVRRDDEHCLEVAVKVASSTGLSSLAAEVVVAYASTDLTVSCRCGMFVDRLCRHGYLLIAYLLSKDAMVQLPKPSGAALQQMAQEAMARFGFDCGADWQNYFDLHRHDWKWKLTLNESYAHVIDINEIDSEAIKSAFVPRPEAMFQYTPNGNAQHVFQVGFCLDFDKYPKEAKMTMIVAKPDKQGNPMRQGFATFQSQEFYRRILVTPSDRALMALSQFLENLGGYGKRLPVDVLEQFRQNRHALEQHPYLYHKKYSTASGLRKMDLQPIYYVGQAPQLVYCPRESKPFVVLEINIRHGEHEFTIKHALVERLHDHFLKIIDTVYFLESAAAAQQYKLATQMAGKHILISEFPAFFDKYLKYALMKSEIDLSNMPDMILSKKAPTCISKEIYLSELDRFVLFKPLLRYPGDQLISPHSVSRVWRLEGDTLEETEQDAQAVSAFTALLEEVFPSFETESIEDYYYLSYDALQDGEELIRIFQRLYEEGVKVFGLRQLQGMRFSPYPAVVSYRVSSRIDWFEVKLEIAWGDVVVRLEDLRKRFVPGSEYIELGNGSRGMLPLEWIKKLERLFRHGQVKDGVLEISDQKFSLIDVLLDPIDDANTRRFIEDRKAKLLGLDLQQRQPLPKGIKATLRHYQKDGFQWMSFLDTFGWGGILADDMGLGKTLQVIVFLKHILTSSKQPNLIVVPTSLLFNWQNELQKFAPSLKAHFYYGSDRIKSTDHFGQHQIILTSYGHVVNDIDLLKDFAFHYVILDESQAIKNPSSKRYKSVRQLKANNRLAITGTPIENNTFDLYAQMSFLNPGLLGSAKAFKEQYAKPIDTDRNAEKAAELQRLIKPFVLRRTKAQVATELPDKTEEVLYCEMGKAQRKIYDAHRNKYRDILLRKINDDGFNKSRFAVLEGLTKLRQICDSPQLLPTEENYEGEAEKVDLLMMHIKEKTANHKILIFSQFVKMLKILERRIGEEGIPYAYLDGKSSTNQRQAGIDRFQNEEDCRVFLISLKAGGTGLNLVAADYVYVVDPWWNPAVENQAIDRCYRIGQEKKVIAYRMICKNTVEEKIMELQQKKKAVASEIITTDEDVLKKMSKDDLMGLFG